MRSARFVIRLIITKLGTNDGIVLGRMCLFWMMVSDRNGRDTYCFCEKLPKVDAGPNVCVQAMFFALRIL